MNHVRISSPTDLFLNLAQPSLYWSCICVMRDGTNCATTDVLISTFKSSKCTTLSHETIMTWQKNMIYCPLSLKSISLRKYGAFLMGLRVQLNGQNSTFKRRKNVFRQTSPQVAKQMCFLKPYTFFLIWLKNTKWISLFRAHSFSFVKKCKIIRFTLDRLKI